MALVESLPSGPSEIRIEGDDTLELTDPSEAASADSATESPGPHRPEDQLPVTIGRYFSTVEAHGCRMALESSGIPAWVLDETIGATYQIAVGVRLQVLARDEAAARAILKEDSAPGSRLSPDPDHEVGEPTDVVVEEPREQGAPAQEQPSSGNGDRPRRLETLELVAVVLMTSAYPILSQLLSGPDDQPIRPGQLTASILWFVGQTCVVWLLLQRRQGSLSPKPLPTSASGWTLESALGLVIFVAVWALHRWLALVLAGVPDAPAPRWAAFFREAGAAPIFALSSFFGVVYEEVVFRAYFVSRLPLLLGGRRALSVLAAAALFALMHGYPPRATWLVFADGVVYGLVYLGSRSLPRLVAAHWFYDLAVMNHYLPGR